MTIEIENGLNIMNLKEFLSQVDFVKFKNKKYYAGIGSRDTPEHILQLMRQIASKLEEQEYVLRSGGAKGADSAFEKGVRNAVNKEIFLAKDADDLTREIACSFHPAPDNLKKNPFAHNLMARNTFQIMGKSLSEPVEFVICWTPDGCEQGRLRTRKTGGTGQAISIASHFKIPVYNLANSKTLKMVKEKLGI